MMIEALETWFADEENKLCVLYKARKLLIPPRITWVPRFLKTAFAFKIFQGYLDRFRRDITDFSPKFITVMRLHHYTSQKKQY
jgi:hypothetical protein